MRRCLGEPDETEVVFSEGDASCWYYESLKLDIIFLRSDYTHCGANDSVQRVNNLGTRHPGTNLWDTTIIGLTEKEVFALFQERGYSSFVLCDDEAPSGYKAYTMDTIGVTLDFKEGLLRRISVRRSKIQDTTERAGE